MKSRETTIVLAIFSLKFELNVFIFFKIISEKSIRNCLYMKTIFYSQKIFKFSKYRFLIVNFCESSRVFLSLWKYIGIIFTRVIFYFLTLLKTILTYLCPLLRKTLILNLYPIGENEKCLNFLATKLHFSYKG